MSAYYIFAVKSEVNFDLNFNPADGQPILWNYLSKLLKIRDYDMDAKILLVYTHIFLTQTHATMYKSWLESVINKHKPNLDQ